MEGEHTNDTTPGPCEQAMAPVTSALVSAARDLGISANLIEDEVSIRFAEQMTSIVAKIREDVVVDLDHIEERYTQADGTTDWNRLYGFFSELIRQNQALRTYKTNARFSMRNLQRAYEKRKAEAETHKRHVRESDGVIREQQQSIDVQTKLLGMLTKVNVAENPTPQTPLAVDWIMRTCLIVLTVCAVVVGTLLTHGH